MSTTAAVPYQEAAASAGTRIEPGKRYGFFTDTTLCIGCKACEVACKEWNLLPAEEMRLSGTSYDNTERLSATTWRHVRFIEQFGDDGEGGVERTAAGPHAGRPDRWLMMSDVCKHCSNAPCLEACPTGAIFKTEFDTVVVQQDICNGCGYCVPACPFSVVEVDELDGKAHKCTLCYDRLKGGLEPACAKACRTDSIQFGELEELDRRAADRVRQLHAKGLDDAYLYGTPGAPGATGGLARLNAFFLLVDRPEVYNLPAAPTRPATRILPALGAGLTALARLANRHMFAGMIRNARHLGTAASAAGAGLLVLDLKTPKRWYNMLRIVRSTSPMSFGSYVLSAFGALTAVTSLSELVGRRSMAGRLLARLAGLAQIGAGVGGAGASTYTASLLSATSSPFWAAAPRHLGVVFATSAVACAAAALSLGERWAGRHETGRRLDDIAVFARLANLLAGVSWSRRVQRRGVPEAATRSPAGRMLDTGELLLAGAVPLAAYTLNRVTSGNRDPVLSVVGSLAILAGGLMLRHGTPELGKETASPHHRLARLNSIASLAYGGEFPLSGFHLHRLEQTREALLALLDETREAAAT